MRKPTIIIKDPYEGKYSSALWFAVNEIPENIPTELYHEDYAIQFVYFDNYDLETDIPVGLGNTPEEAVEDLQSKLVQKQAMMRLERSSGRVKEIGENVSIGKELDELKKLL